MIAKQPEHDEEVGRLIGLLVEGALEPTDYRRLEEILLADATALEYYQDYLDLHCLLHWHHGQSESEEVGADFRIQNSEVGDNAPAFLIHSSSQTPNPSAIPHIVVDSSSAPRTSPNILQSPVGSFVFSHIAAAVILGIGLLIGLAWRISLPEVGDSDRQPPGIAQTVARITALADCKWTKQGSGDRDQGTGISNPQIPKSLNPQIPICLGDRLVLSAGLMQITYNSGAEVILQGPCTYEIDSVRSGYLAVGKLTALVEKGAGVWGPGSGNANHSLLFAVRTPTAVVTDLGTEFGVEVEESGATRSHVFQGKVELRENSREFTTPGASPLILQAGESASVKRGRNNKVAITREPSQLSRFVREIDTSTHQQISKSSSSSLIPHPSSFAYRLTDLGTLGGQQSFAMHLNTQGQVVGWANTPTGAQHAFLYENGAMRDIASLSDEMSSANHISDRGIVVGDSSGGPGLRRAFAYDGRVMVDLGTLGSHDAVARSVNQAGTIVGVSKNAAGVDRAFVYTRHDGMKDLGSLGGPKARSLAFDINAAGTIVGFSETANGSHRIFMYSPHVGMRSIGETDGEAYCINNAGQIVGQLSDGNMHAFLFDKRSGVQRLIHPEGYQSVAMGLNNAGSVVGHLTVRGADHRAFLYRDGKMIDLNKTIEKASGWFLGSAMAINDDGQIVGIGRSPQGHMRAFLLTPVNQGQGAKR